MASTTRCLPFFKESGSSGFEGSVNSTQWETPYRRKNNKSMNKILQIIPGSCVTFHKNDGRFRKNVLLHLHYTVWVESSNCVNHPGHVRVVAPVAKVGARNSCLQKLSGEPVKMK